MSRIFSQVFFKSGTLKTCQSKNYGFRQRLRNQRTRETLTFENKLNVIAFNLFSTGWQHSMSCLERKEGNQYLKKL